MTMFTNSNARRRSVIWILLMIAVASLSTAGLQRVRHGHRRRFHHQSVDPE